MQAVLAAQTTIAEATLDLGAIAQSIVAQLKTGDLLSALVLPPSGGVDHISLFGQSLPAQLPPGLAPGDTLVLQVTGFSPTQIFVRNLGTVDPQNPPAIMQVEIPSESAPAQATLIAGSPVAHAPVPSQQSGNAAASSQTASPRSSIAPPVEVFVAASVQPSRRDITAASSQEAEIGDNASAGNAPAANGPAATAPAATAPAGNAPAGNAPAANAPAANAPAANAPAANAPAANASAANAPAATASTLQRSNANQVFASELEARLATARGARILPPPPQAPASAESQAPAIAQSAARAAPLDALPPQIAMRAPIPATEVNVANAPLQPSSEEELLLARLNLPATPALLAAARIAQNAPAQLATAFARAESVLGRFASQAAAGSVRSAMAFVSTIDPSNALALPQQLAAYIRTILGSTEGALATLAEKLVAFEPSPPTSAQFSEPAHIAVAAPIERPAQSVAPSVPTIASPAHEAAVITAESALGQDIKSALITLARDPQSAAIPGAAAALNDAATVISAAQVHFLAANAADPRTLVVPLPIFFREGGAPTQLRVGRDAPGSKKTMDADNFTLGFLLDTKSMGTVAIEIETSGRAVSVKVKTERDGAANRFRQGFGALRDRFEALRYRVATMQAAVAARSMPPGAGSKRPQEVAPRSQLDAQA